MDRLAETAPDLQVEVVQSETAPALEDLRSQAADLVVGVEYDPVPVPRQRDVDRRDLLQEDVLLALHPEHAAATKRGPVRLAACEHAAWASGHRGTGLDAVVRNVCNRLGGFEPDIRHRSDDGLVLSALVASGRAVALLPALLATGMPEISARRLREERLQRTIFTATRVTASEAPAVLAVRDALLATARQVAARQRNLEVLA
jgi:DNA-binding transcriptional LysR family regulator